MRNVSGPVHHIRQLTGLLLKLSVDAWRFLILCLRPAPALAAENLFLRKQLALYEEWQVKPWRASNAIRLAIGLTHRETGDLYEMASSGFSPVLAVEIQAGPTASAQGLAGADSPHGAGESDLGPGADRQRTLAQTRDSGVSSNGA
jgi:hypothetical protein